MPRRPKCTLKHDDKTDRWDVQQDRSRKFLTTFETNADTTAGGVLERAIGPEGG